LEDEQEELRRLTAEIELLQSQANVQNQNLELLTLSLSELKVTLETLEQLKKIETGKELLIPLGSGSYVRSSLKQNDKVIIGVGSGFSVEKDVDEAKATVDKRAAELESAIQKTRERMQEISGRLEELTPKWQQLYKESAERQATAT